MKKFSILIVGMLLVSLLGSCKKDNTGNYKVVFKANVQQPNSGSKTSIQPDGSVLWSSDDAIKVYNGDTQSAFALLDGAGTTSASFGGDIAEADTYYGAYPASAATFSKSGDNKVVTFTLPATQQVGTSANDFDPNVSLMVAASNTQSFSFNNVFGILALSMKSANGISHVTKFELTAKNNVNIWGSSCSVTVNDNNTFAWNGFVEGGKSSITLTCDVTLTETPQTFYILVPPVTMDSGLELKIYNADDEIYSLETSNPVTIGSNTGATFSHTEGGEPLVIEPTEEPAYDPAATPLTFEARVANVSVGFGGSIFAAPALEYSKNGCEWTSFPGQITLENVGDIVSFRGNNSSTVENQFSCSGQCYIYGNVMSLLHADDYATNYTLASSAFYQLFMGNTNIDIHPDKDLVLPATTLAYYCYREMFRGCESLTKAPALPAETLTDYCYDRMFLGCTSLTTAPELPATTLANNCYRYMFRGCASLTTAPELPATTLASSCYSNMFLFCASLTTAPELPATTLASSCYSGMFQGCTSLTTAPELPAETLTNSCYSSMFRGCSQLSSITCLATSGVNEENTDFWVDGVAATGTFYADPSATWSTGASGIPTGWTRLNPDGSPWVEPVPAGAINGLFSVSATQQVWFSQGNLLNTGNFADNQYAYGGLLQWAASFTSNYSGDWRALTSEEWNYLFTNRTNASNLWGFANVQDSNEIQFFNGIILLPDGSSLSINTNHSAWDNNSIDNTTWLEMEANGAVFLPAAGYSDGYMPEDSGNKGYYWCSTNGGYVRFGGSGSSFEAPTYYEGGSRRSVRLVINAQ